MTTTPSDDETRDPMRSSTPVSERDQEPVDPDEVERPGVPLPSGFEFGRRRRVELSPEAKARVQRAWDEFDRSQLVALKGARTHVIG